MTSDKDIESTERLLRIIRKDDTADSAMSAPGKMPATAQAVPFFSSANKACLAAQIGIQALHCALVTYQRGRPSFQNLSSFPYPADLTPESPAFPAFLGRCILQASAGAKPEVWTFISPDHAEHSFLKVPNVAAKDLHQSVFWTMKKDSKLDEKTHIFDYRVLDRVMDKGVEKRLVAYFLAQASEVDRLKAVFSQAGYPLSGLSIEPLALQNFFTTQWVEKPRNVITHLQLGEESSRIDILEQGRLLFSRNIKSGANSFIEAIQDEQAEDQLERALQPDPPLQLTLEVMDDSALSHEARVTPGRERIDARALFQNSITSQHAGARSTGPQPDPDQLLEMILPALDRLVRQLERTMEHSVNQLGFQPAEKILISGPAALFPGLKDYIVNQFTIPVELFDPLNPDLLPAQGSLPASILTRMELQPAAGLALSANERTMNVLHTYVHRSQEKKKRLITRGAALLSLLLVGVVFALSFHASSSLRQLEAKIQAEEGALAELAAFPDTREILTTLEAVRDKDARLKRYLARYKPLATVGTLSATTPVWTELEWASFSFISDQENGEEGTGSVHGLVSGQLETLDAFLGTYILMLADSDVFYQPRLSKKESVQKRPGETRLEFQVDFRLR